MKPLPGYSLRHILFCAAGLIMLLTGNLLAGTTDPLSMEYRVKAAFIYNFTKFIEWPTAPADPGTTPFCIGIVGEDPFGPEIDALAFKTVGNRPIEVKRFCEWQVEVCRCQVVYFVGEDSERLAWLLERLANRPILTLAHGKGLAARGVMINFFEERQRLRFEINLQAAHQAGLKISSRLLKLARLVVPTGKEPSQ